MENQKAEAVTFKDFTMGGFAEQVGLMQLVEGTVTEFNHEITKSFEGDGWTVEAAKTSEDGFSLYVPETAGNNIKQYVKMETTDGKTYRGLLKTSGILRNQALPLNLILHDDTYELTIHAYVAPIGGYPAEVRSAPRR